MKSAIYHMKDLLIGRVIVVITCFSCTDVQLSRLISQKHSEGLSLPSLFSNKLSFMTLISLVNAVGLAFLVLFWCVIAG